MFSLRPIQNREYRNKCELESHNLLFSLTKRFSPSILTAQLMSATSCSIRLKLAPIGYWIWRSGVDALDVVNIFVFLIIHQLQTVYGVKLSLDISQHRRPIKKLIGCENCTKSVRWHLQPVHDSSNCINTPLNCVRNFHYICEILKLLQAAVSWNCCFAFCWVTLRW